MNDKVKEFLARVELGDKEIHSLWLTIGDPFIPRYLDVGRRTAKALLNKVLNDPDLALIDREGKMPTRDHKKPRSIYGYEEAQRDYGKAGFTHSIIPLRDAIKEVKNERD